MSPSLVKLRLGGNNQVFDTIDKLRIRQAQAIDAGFIDEVVEVGNLESRSREVAEQLARLPSQQFSSNKLVIRAETLDVMKRSLESFG